MKNIGITIVLLIAMSSYLFSQADEDVWNNYLNETGAYTEDNSHEIFKRINYPDGTFKTGRTINLKLYLQHKYDTLYKNNPDKFKWIVKPLPEGAQFTSNDKTLSWEPGVEQTGNYEITFYIKYEDKVDSIKSKFTVNEEWESSWMPGVSFSYYQPDNKSQYGTLMGPSVEYLLVSWIHRNENKGPSHGRVYIKLDMLSSDNDTITDSFVYSMGTNLSIERNAQRSWLIPFYGLELGGFYNKITANVFFIAPTAGVWIYTSQNIHVNFEAKYQLPTYDFENLKGYKLNLGFNMSLW